MRFRIVFLSWCKQRDQTQIGLNAMGPKKEKKEKKNSIDFIWTDEESELLLSIANDLKGAKASEGVDWESVKTKYSDIL